eukprot:GDKJ01003936.1.p1 GENE.GDKJ01003936.1~~GDKJ01003936.1.p1  ORF type:complete len:176 (+),score=40.28 GDKJ01003936.1:44-571(+)
MDILKNIEEAKMFKERGNDFFKAGELTEALKEYHKSVLHAKGLVVSMDVACFSHLGSDTQKEIVKAGDKTEVRSVLGQTYCNMSLVYYQQQKYVKSKEYAEKSLDVCPSMKGHFRRAEAFFRMGQLLQARSECERVFQWDASNAGAKNLIRQIDILEQAAEAKQKAGLKKMFGGK